MLYPSLPGTTWKGLGEVGTPTGQETVEMLHALRSQVGWSQEVTGAIMGVKLSSIRQWEAYRNRTPCIIARKLIWLLHQTLILRNTLDPIRIATWGKLDGIPLAKLERLIARTTPKPIAEPETAQGEAGMSRKEKDTPVSGGVGGVARAQGDPHMRNSTSEAETGHMRNSDVSSETGVTRNSIGISDGAADLASSSTEAGSSGFTGKVSEDKVRLANPRKVQVVLGHGRIYRRVKRRTERARKKELGKAYRKVKYEVPEGIKDGDDSWKWG